MDLIGYVEYVNENNDCKNQENNENDANNNPSGYACSRCILDDCNLNVFGHLFPTNNLCALGKLCVECFCLAVVCNTVYNPSGNILNSSDKSVNFCQELGLVEAFGFGVTVGQLESAVSIALYSVENEVCGSTCQGGNVGCVQNGTCGNSDNDGLVGYGNCGVFSGNVEIGSESTNGNFITCDFLNELAICVVELNLNSVACLGGNCDLDTCIGIFNSHVITCVNVVVFVSEYACECNSVAVGKSSLDKSGIICVFDVVGQSLAVCGPNVTGLNSINIALELCKYVLVELVELVGAANVCLTCKGNGDLSLLFVYTEEVDSLTVELISEVSTAVPRPTLTYNCRIVGKIEAENSIYNVVCSNVCGVLVFANFVTIYIIVNVVVFNCICIVLNGNCIAGHYKGVGALCGENEACAFKYSIYILVSCQGVNIKSYGDFCALFEVYTVDGLVVGFEQGSNNLIDRGTCNVGLIVFDCEQILVNDGVVRKVLCYEGNALCTRSSYFNVSYAVCVNKGLLGVVGFNACERNSDNNGCICAKCVVALNCIVKVEIEIVSCSAAVCCKTKCCIRSNLGLVVKANNSIACCISDELVQHCNVESYVVQALFGCKYEVEVCCRDVFQNFNRHCKAELCCPSCLQDNLVFGSGAFGYIILTVYQTVDGYIGNDYFGFIGSSFFGSSLLGNFGSGLFGSGFCSLEGSLNGDILCGHLVDDCIGSNITPAFKVSNAVVVVNHFGQLNAGGQESGEDNLVVFANKGCLINVAYANSYLCTCGDNGNVSKYHVDDIVDFCSDHILASIYSRNARCCYVEGCLHLVADDSLYIKGNFFVEQYELGIACIEAHKAEICKLLTDLACEQTVCNTNSVALNVIVNVSYVFYLINSYSVKECERIGGSCCLLEQILHIEVITCYFAELIENVVNGVIIVTVDLCGQTVGDLLAGNAFELVYKYFECGNGCESVNEVLCFEVIGEIIAGISFNEGKKNLCVTRGENLVVCLAKESGIYCFENSHDLFHGQAFCKRDEIIGVLSVDSENLILDGICQSAFGITKLVESYAENACKLGRNVNVYDQLAFCKTDVADLIEYVGKLCCGLADEIHTGSESKVEGDFLGNDFSIPCFALVVGDCKACAEQLAAIVNVCELLEGGQHIFKSFEKLLRIQLNCIGGGINNSNCIAVDLDFGNGSCNGVVDTNDSEEVTFEIELIEKSLSNAGLVKNLYSLLVVNHGKDCANVKISNKSFDFNKLGKVTALNKGENRADDRLNVKRLNKAGNVYILYSILVAANCTDNSLDTNSINSCTVAVEASNNICGGDEAIVKSIGDLSLDNVNLNKVSIAVISSKCIYADDVVSNQLLNVDDTVIEQTFNICRFIAKVFTKNFKGETVGICFDESFQSILVNVLSRQCSITDNVLDVGKVCSSLNVNTVECNSLIKINDFEKLCSRKIQSKIHQLCRIIVDKSIDIDMIDSVLDICVTNVGHYNVDSAILNVGLQIHTLDEGDETVFIYAVKQFISIQASNQLFYVDISDDRLNKSNDLFLGDNCQNFFFGQNITKATTCRDAFEQTLNVAVFHVGKKHLRINGNGNVGRRYVFNRCLVCVYAQPIISKRTDRQNSQNSYEC